MNFSRIGIALCLLATINPCPVPAQTEPQSLIFFNGVILTMDKQLPQAQAIAIQDSKIRVVGRNDEILALSTPATQLIDLHGSTLIPGFVDAHTHIFNDAYSQGMSLDQAQALALQNGITTLGDLFIDRTFLRQFRKFEEQGLLRVRTSLYLVYNDPCGKVFGDWYKSFPPTRLPGEMLRINGVKIFTDGGACGSPALSFELEKGNGLGDLWMSQDELNEAVVEAQSLGYQVAIHAIGDRAVEQAQNALAFALNGQANIYRHRMEHVSVLHPGMVKRFGELGIIPVIPGQYHSCAPFGPPLPEKYGEWEWPWRDLRQVNPDLHIAWHSDFPFWSENPFVHLYGFVTRRDVLSYYTCSPQEWLKDDTLSVEQALSIMTIESAYALFRDEEVGSLVPGKYADMIVLSQDPLTVDAEELKDIKVLATLVNGQFEYCAKGQDSLCPGYSNRMPTPLPDVRPSRFMRWLIAILVIALPIAVVRLGRSRLRSSIAIAGMAGILSGLLLFLLYWVLQEDPVYQDWTVLAALVCMSITTAGMSLLGASRFVAATLLLASFGAATAAESIIIAVWFGYENLWIIILFGSFFLVGGLFAFGLANLKARILPCLNWVPLATVVVGIPVPILLNALSRSGIDWPLLAFTSLFGSGWPLMGFVLLLGSKPIRVEKADRS